MQELWKCINSFDFSFLFTQMYMKSIHQGSALSPLLFAIVVDVITENARRRVVNELLYADDLVVMSETMEDLKERFWN